jgi:hypothetical protein
MAFLDIVFRRVAHAAGAVAPKDAEPRSRAGAPKREKKSKNVGGFYYWSFFIHKWAGLIGAAWLAVLGLTGFFLDHDSWRWLMQGKAPAFLTPAALEASAARGVVRLLQIDPDQSSAQVAGGPRGLWWSADGGDNWTLTRFTDGDHPQILAIEPDPALGWRRLWFASDNGLYVSWDQGASAEPVALKGEYVTALAAAAAPEEMLAVIDKSEVLRFKTDDPTTPLRLELGPLDRESRVLDVQLNRFARDLHFGKGAFDQMTSLALNDVGGIGMLVLSLTGLLYWGLPKWWKRRAQSAGAVSKQVKAARRETIVWLFRLHSATLGIASVVMLLYLAITGILIGHGRELGDWLRATRIPQAYLTPAFGGASWKGWIEAIVAYPGQPDAYTIGNRIGMFTTVDGGQTWAREDDAKGEPFRTSSRMRRIGDKVLVSGGMAGPSYIRGGDDVSREVVVSEGERKARGGQGRRAGKRGDREGAGGMEGMDHAHHSGMEAMRRGDGMGGMNGMDGMFMPSDMTRIGDNFAWKSSSKIFVTDASGKEIESFEIRQPSDPGAPWFSWLLRVHMGTIFWSEWRWINDIFAVLAVFLSVTGLIRWWRQKWM